MFEGDRVVPPSPRQLSLVQMAQELADRLGVEGTQPMKFGSRIRGCASQSGPFGHGNRGPLDLSLRLRSCVADQALLQTIDSRIRAPIFLHILAPV